MTDPGDAPTESSPAEDRTDEPGAGKKSGHRKRRHRSSPINEGLHWVDDRLGVSKFTESVLDKIFPDHWSFMLGEVALYCFVVLVVTGIYLTFFFSPSNQTVIYHGSYKIGRAHV